MTESLTVTLPWPSKSLSPNARLHWSRVAAFKQIAKRDAFYATKAVRREKIAADSLAVRVSFFPPDRRRRDHDNMVASMKAAFDGIAEAVEIDDSKWRVHFVPVDAAVKGGKVVVELEWNIHEGKTA